MPNIRSLDPCRAWESGGARARTVALASAALAFFSRALQASRSSRRFCKSRLSFCRVEDRDSEASPDLARDPREAET